jgi:hypothetical protein
MSEAPRWIVVDDQLSEAQAFAASFQTASQSDACIWDAMQASDAQIYLLGSRGEGIAGALIDVDLSSDGRVIGTGLGLAQDLRARQKNRQSLDFPLIRFANADPVRRYVGDDPVSDDLFDLLIPKEFSRVQPDIVARQASAARDVYLGLADGSPADSALFARFVGLDPQTFEIWGDARLWQKVRLGMSSSSATHVAAGTFLRSFLLPSGLLIDEATVAVRLGIDRAHSPDWEAVREALNNFRYLGCGSAGFDRWWARGIDAFWLNLECEEYLHQRTSTQRVEVLKKFFGVDLVALQPTGRYWRLCSLSLRSNDQVPIEPEHALTLLQHTPQEPWIEPEQADVNVAAMFRDDPRVDADELARLRR